MKWLPKRPTAGDYVAEFVDADAAALQALSKGTATEEQQKSGLKWIIENASGLYEDPFHENQRWTDYNLGRQYVGRSIVTLLNYSLMESRKRRGKHG